MVLAFGAQGHWSNLPGPYISAMPLFICVMDFVLKTLFPELDSDLLTRTIFQTCQH